MYQDAWLFVHVIIEFLLGVIAKIGHHNMVFQIVYVTLEGGNWSNVLVIISVPVIPGLLNPVIVRVELHHVVVETLQVVLATEGVLVIQKKGLVRRKLWRDM